MPTDEEWWKWWTLLASLLNECEDSVFGERDAVYRYMIVWRRWHLEDD